MFLPLEEVLRTAGVPSSNLGRTTIYKKVISYTEPMNTNHLSINTSQLLQNTSSDTPNNHHVRNDKQTPR